MTVRTKIPLEEVAGHAEYDPYGYWLPGDLPTSLTLQAEPMFTLVFEPDYPSVIHMTLSEVADIQQQREMVAVHRAAATRFFERIADVPGVRTTEVTSVSPDLVITVRTDDRDMERDLLLQALFADETRDLLGGETLRVRLVDAADAE